MRSFSFTIVRQSIQCGVERMLNLCVLYELKEIHQTCKYASALKLSEQQFNKKIEYKPLRLNGHKYIHILGDFLFVVANATTFLKWDVNQYMYIAF